MTRDEFAKILIRERHSEIDTAVRILWFLQRIEKQDVSHPRELIEFFLDQAISNPNTSRFQARLGADRRVFRDPRNGLLRLRAWALEELDQEYGYVDEANRTPASMVMLVPPRLVKGLEVHANKLREAQTRSFVLEAIQCLRNKTPRAAIIMSWCGAVSVMQEYVFKYHLDAFNTDAVKHGLLKSPAKSLADMRDISKESQFLECLARISLLDDATKRTLKRCLDRRNDVGHPSEVKLSDAAVADHIEALTLNVFERFSGPELVA